MALRLVFVLDSQQPDALAGFWTEALHYRKVHTDEPYVVLVPDGTEGTEGPEILLQRVPEPKTTKNRMHLDIVTAELDAEVERLASLGARRLQDEVIEEAGCCWVVMADPEGNEFCVCCR